MHADQLQTRPLSCPEPRRIQHALHGLSLKSKDVAPWASPRVPPPRRRPVQPPPPPLPPSRRGPVQPHKPLAAVLHMAARNNENRGSELRNRSLPLPPQIAD